MAKIKKETVYKLAKALKNHVETKYEFPDTLTVDGVKFNKRQMMYTLSYGVVHLLKEVNIPSFNAAPNPNANSIKEEITKAKYLGMNKDYLPFITSKKRLPNYILTPSKKKSSNKLLAYSNSKIIVFYHNKKRLPETCLFQSSVFSKTKTPTKTESADEVFNYFVKIFGKVSTIDEALKKVINRGYAYYYDSAYSNKTGIDRIKAGKGINCTDSAQIFYHIAKALGYEVKVMHVQCSSGGHVRLKLKHSKHTSGNWIDRDPAAVLSNNGQPVNYIWCSNAPVIATNPSWFMADVNW